MDNVSTPDWGSLSPTPPPTVPDAPSTSEQTAPDWNSLSTTAPENNSDQTPDWNSLQTADQKYGTTGQEILSGIEGVAKGFLSAPVTTGIEKGLSKLGVPSLSDEDIKGREKANPWIEGLAEMGGLATGALTGVGELGLIGKGYEALSGAQRLAKMGTAAKLGSAAIKGAIEASAIHIGDNISGAMLGKEGYDPEAPVASVLARTGWSALGGGLLGGVFEGVGAGLKNIGNAKAGTNARQFLADVSKELTDNNVVGDMGQAVTGELKDLHEAVKAARDGVWGDEGLYTQAIKRLAPEEVSDSLNDHNQNLYDILQNKYQEMIKDPDLYSKGDTAQFRQSFNDWFGKIADQNSTPSDMFLATNQLKREVQQLADYGKQLGVRPSDRAFIEAMRDIGTPLKESLEDSKVWGEAGNLQQDLNSATSKLIGDKGPLKFFENRFTTAQAGAERFVREDAGEQLVRQLEKASGEAKRDTLRNFIQPAKDYLDAIDNVYTKNGVVSPIARPSTNSLDKLLEENPSSGAQFGRYLVNKGLPGIAEKTALRVGGALLGEHFMPGASGVITGLVGEETLRPLIERVIGKPITGSLQKYILPTMLNALSKGGDAGLWKLMDYAGSVAKGEASSNAAIESLFDGTRNKAVTNLADSEVKRNRDKLKKYIENGDLNREIETSLRQSKHVPAVQHFAEGGEVVKSIESFLPSKNHKVSPAVQDSPLANNLPEQNTLLQTAKGRVVNYLNNLRPESAVSSKLPFDHMPEDENRKRAYDRAIDIAHSPMSVLNHVKDGSLTPDDMKHLISMYPEVYRHLSKKITHKISEIQASPDAKPPKYETRQGLSLFLGAPMDTTFTPQAIQAVQEVYAEKKALLGQNTPTKLKKGTSTLTKAPDASYTGSQAREMRQHTITRG